MKLTAKILKFEDKKLETVEEVRAVPTAILGDIESGDVTVSEATPIRDEIKKMMRKFASRGKAQSQRTTLCLSYFLVGRDRHGVHTLGLYLYLFVASVLAGIGTAWLGPLGFTVNTHVR